MGPQSSATQFQPARAPSPSSFTVSLDNDHKETPLSPEVARQQIIETRTQQGDTPHQRPRRFLAQPIETSSRSVQTQNNLSDDRQSYRPGSLRNEVNNSVEQQLHRPDNPPRRFLPQPIETSKASNQGVTGSRPRRFKPELLETEHRSVKGATDNPSHRQFVNFGPAKAGLEYLGDRPGPTSRLTPPRSASFDVPESRFSYANLLRRHETRRHSFRVPDLPSIPSNSSESSDTSCETPSLPPQKSSVKLVQSRKNGQLNRESRPSEFSGYLLSLAARSAQKELKEQALAAFPNEQVYQPVDHFAIDEEGGDSEDDEYLIYPQPHHIKSRRQSSADLSWELEYMRQHKEEAEQRFRVMVSSKNLDFSSPSHNAASKNRGPSPPMLGVDLVLPQSLSPDGTLCEDSPSETNTQGQQGLCNDCGGLWCAGDQPEEGRGAGLWMGTCRKDEGFERGSQLMTGIMTPMIECEEFTFTPNSSLESHTDSRDPRGKQSQGMSGPRRKIDGEFHDGFVTQIYNYLSLGYPCVARYYDFELSKISGIPLEDLRRDDLCADAQGYVVAPLDNLAVGCVRWKALRLYIHEWARQQPNMVEDEPSLEAWGVPERRGSWAI
ncbi:uncharacterized protein N7496_006216 [Penicillium cataractarum]|uniref:Uncharacterized protein n=1 Tax=Penicillium cataractarum TaxID=2100454 RepID=A0A9W9S320_9EURO|nr:uncharacterized protein N7496_006216 [Penicillium cataractarum]KAJ5370124.1 hypothetical protein N7496_006216 [Penicillium cataractarum]